MNFSIFLWVSCKYSFRLGLGRARARAGRTYHGGLGTHNFRREARAVISRCRWTSKVYITGAHYTVSLNAAGILDLNCTWPVDYAFSFRSIFAPCSCCAPPLLGTPLKGVRPAQRPKPLHVLRHPYSASLGASCAQLHPHCNDAVSVSVVKTTWPQGM
ncbi:hypothetical protein BU23DRAFT_17017 [Bimuria novae-zelandiae CBS 107.79]|uniref:Uncharacterized protein n=1 Tax=Bimuria novae-zelandiae CBS 107.79 TaxID=1447943 RepID=A0A6A5UPN8_9PLEO|nr:hypothetical protein BU23DRAFT_17017 [Bimuria novae-zelandiae CBS 107.79]